MKFNIGKMTAEILEAGGLKAVELTGDMKPDYTAEGTVFYRGPELEVTAENVNAFHGDTVPVFIWLSDEFDMAALELDIFDRVIRAVSGKDLKGKGFRLTGARLKDRTVHAPGKFELMWDFVAREYDTEDESVPVEKRAKVLGKIPGPGPEKK